MNANQIVDNLLEGDMEHFYQECGYDCGPTCIKMVAKALGKGQDKSIADLVQLCGSDNVTGTDDKRMIRGLEALGVPYEVGTVKDTDGLAEALGRGSYIILRTLTQGIKHWIVLYGFHNGVFLVNDPWLGRKTYTPEEVMAIWKPRDYYYFEIPKAMTEAQDGAKIQPISNEVMPQLRKAITAVFGHFGDWVVPYVLQYMDPDISVVATINGQVIGFYILGNRQLGQGIADEQLTPVDDIEPYNSRRGVEGVALGIVPGSRGTGLGSKLKDYPATLGADYIWGLQLNALGNLEHWTKRRRVVAKNGQMVATVQDYRVAESVVARLLEVEDEIDISPAEVVAGADEARFQRALKALHDPNARGWKTAWDNVFSTLGYNWNPWVWPATNSMEAGSVQIVQGVNTADAVFYAMRDNLIKKLYVPERDLNIIQRLLNSIPVQQSDEIHGEDEDWYE